MREELQQYLNKISVHLVREIDPDDGLFPRLLAKDALTAEQTETCQAKSTKSKTVEELLTLLNRRPNDCYFKFCEALNEIGRDDLVKQYLTPEKFRDPDQNTAVAAGGASGTQQAAETQQNYHPSQYSGSRPPQYNENVPPGGGGYGGVPGGLYGGASSGYNSQDFGRGDAGRSGQLSGSSQQFSSYLRLKTLIIPEDVTTIPFSHLRGVTQIAEGGFGIISRASHIDWGTVAYKKLKVSVINPKDRLARELQREVQVRVLRHQNIVAILGVVFEPEQYGIVMEFATFGGLDDFIEKYSVEIMMKMSIAHGIVLGMNYLHTCEPPVIHGELKMQNVLVVDGYVPKICDFGLSKWKLFSTTNSGSRTMRGTVTNIPPENWSNINLSRTVKYDVYGFGILLYELLSQMPAFANAQGNADHIKVLVVDRHRPDLDDIVADKPDSEVMLEMVKDNIRNFWAQDPNDRPTFAEVESIFNSIMATFENQLAIAKANLDAEIQQYGRP